MNHYYRFFIQALRHRKLSYGAHMDQILKGTPYGMGITRDSKLGLHWGMASTTKRLKRKFCYDGKPTTNSGWGSAGGDTRHRQLPNKTSLGLMYKPASDT